MQWTYPRNAWASLWIRPGQVLQVAEPEAEKRTAEKLCKRRVARVSSEFPVIHKLKLSPSGLGNPVDKVWISRSSD
jgi:hypothetical protein